MITMYGTQTCSDCARARTYFDDHAVEYTDIDVSDNAEAMAKVIDYNDGRSSVPVVVFPDGTHLTEPSNDELAAKLAAS